MVHLLPSFARGGAEIGTVDLVEGLLDGGIDAWLVALRGDGPAAHRRSPRVVARTIVIGRQHRVDARALSALVAALRRVQPDVVHSHLFTGLLWGELARRAAGVPHHVHTRHAVHPEPAAPIDALRRHLQRQVDRVVAPSEAIARALGDEGVPAARRCAIDHAIAVPASPVAHRDAPKPLRVGVVGRLVPVKGHDVLLDALARRPDLAIHVDILGDGPRAAPLADRVRTLDLAARVTLHGAVDDVSAWHGRWDAYVQPSLQEGQPLAVLEAAAAGLPLVLSDGGGTASIARHADTGPVVPAGDPDALGAALARVAAASTAQRRVWGYAAREAVIRHHAMPAAVSAYALLYAGLG